MEETDVETHQMMHIGKLSKLSSDTRWEASYVAVSYTHLDVYKRQPVIPEVPTVPEIPQL